MKKAVKYSKKKTEPNQPGPGFRTRSDFRVKQSLFGKGAPIYSRNPMQVKFNPSTFKTQHKG